MIAKARTFYFDTFLPAVVLCLTITRSVETISLPAAAHVATKITVQEENEGDEEVQLLSVSSVSSPSICLETFGCVRHTVDGDRNCLFYAVAHQAGLIGQNCRRDFSVANQLRTLALVCMQKYPDVCMEDGMTIHQWDQQKLDIVRSAQWGEM